MLVIIDYIREPSLIFTTVQDDGN